MSFRPRNDYSFDSDIGGQLYGSAIFGIFWEAGTSRQYFRHFRGGGGGTQTGGWTKEYHLPPDFQGFTTDLFCRTRRSGATTSFKVYCYNEAGTIDPAYSGGITIRPVADATWEPFVLPNPTGTYAAGERCLFDVESVLPGNTNHEITDFYFEFAI